MGKLGHAIQSLWVERKGTKEQKDKLLNEFMER
jgi:hypothetical protein